MIYVEIDGISITIKMGIDGLTGAIGTDLTTKAVQVKSHQGEQIGVLFLLLFPPFFSFIALCLLLKFEGETIAIDASPILYQYLIGYTNRPNESKDKDGKSTAHLVGIFKFTRQLLEDGIKPVYVFFNFFCYFCCIFSTV